jgi:hypothetical protein
MVGLCPQLFKRCVSALSCWFSQFWQCGFRNCCCPAFAIPVSPTLSCCFCNNCRVGFRNQCRVVLAIIIVLHSQQLSFWFRYRPRVVFNTCRVVFAMLIMLFCYSRCGFLPPSSYCVFCAIVIMCCL